MLLRQRRRWIPFVALLAAASACTDEDAPATTPADYTAAMGAICSATTDGLDSLPEPVDDPTVREFAAGAAGLLRAEADAARDVAVPDELDDDHRAFVLNTDDQAAAWEQLAATPSADAGFGDVTRRIGELTLGRDDLASEMGIDACRRTTP